MSKRLRIALAVVAAVVACVAVLLLVISGMPEARAMPAPDRLVVHEWGTFTVLQDEHGEPIGAINTDDEPLPPFVHQVYEATVPLSDLPLPSLFAKGVPSSHPDVWVRLETPVVYFYPPAGLDKPLDVSVTFRGGWLTEYYPDAEFGGTDVKSGAFRLGRITPETEGSLTWRGLKLAGDADGPKTAEEVWLAPRRVAAATSVTTPAGERERYLFYRGIGHVRAPLRVSRDAAGDLEIRGQSTGEWTDWVRARHGFRVGPLWLVDVRAGGELAFRVIDGVDLARDEEQVLASTKGTFEEKDFAAANLKSLRDAMHVALVRDGLYPDEATAMLKTWEVSYFRRPGLRLFFLVPRPWTEHVLPLKVSESAEVARVMVGRIELVTQRQRELLSRIAKGPVSDPSWTYESVQKVRAARGVIPDEGDGTALRALGIKIPDDYAAFLELGRFRNALVNDELKRRPTDALKRFALQYGVSEIAFPE